MRQCRRGCVQPPPRTAAGPCPPMRCCRHSCGRAGRAPGAPSGHRARSRPIGVWRHGNAPTTRAVPGSAAPSTARRAHPPAATPLPAASAGGSPPAGAAARTSGGRARGPRRHGVDRCVCGRRRGRRGAAAAAARQPARACAPAGARVCGDAPRPRPRDGRSRPGNVSASPDGAATVRRCRRSPRVHIRADPRPRSGAVPRPATRRETAGRERPTCVASAGRPTRAARRADR